jgi:proteasome accessory factor A
MIEAYMARHGCTFEDGRVAALDLQYHDVRPDKSLYERLGMERVAGEDDVQRAVTEPPPDTRAYFRGRCLQRFAKSIVAANWDSIVLDVGGDPLRRIPMMEPLKGTAAHVDTLFDGCDTPTELLERLGS